MFGRRITLFEVLAFKIRIDASWLILAGLVVWGLADGYFPNLAPGLAALEYWMMGFAGLIGLAGSIILHELGHAVVARRYGMQIRGITLFLFGGIAEMDEEPSSPKGEAVMALAGPAVSLALSALCWAAAALLVHGVFGPPPLGLLLVVSYVAFINGLLALFNMIPAFPLDGGRVLRAVLWGWRKDLIWATRLAGRTGVALGIAVMLGGLYVTASGDPIGGGWWILIGLFIRAAAIGSVRHQLHLAALVGQPVSRFVEPHPVSVPPDLPLDRFLADTVEVYGLASFPVVQPDGRLLGRVRADAASQVAVELRPLRCVGQLVEAYPAEAVVAETSSAAAAHARMRRFRRRFLIVVRDGRLTGTLSLSRLQAYLSARHQPPANDDAAAARRSGAAEG